MCKDCLCTNSPFPIKVAVATFFGKIFSIYAHRLRLVKNHNVFYSIIIMFAKLGDYLNEHNIQRPTRYVTASGEEFVVLPAKEYSLLTGIDIEALPTMCI